MPRRESELENNLFFACGLVEYISRATHNTSAYVVDAIGREGLTRIVEYADVLHCENIEAVCARVVDEAGIAPGSFDALSGALYGVPTHWDMGKVYKRLVLGIMRERGTGVADAMLEAFHSPIAPLLSDYNGSFFYEAPGNILIAHLTGVIE